MHRSRLLCPIFLLAFFDLTGADEACSTTNYELDEDDQYRYFNFEKVLGAMDNTTQCLTNIHLFNIKNKWPGQAILLTIKCEVNCETKFEIFEVAYDDRHEYRIPRYLPEQTRYVGAIKSDFMVVMRTSWRENRNKFFAHVTFSTNEPYSNGAKEFNYSCPYPHVHLHGELNAFQPEHAHFLYDCAVLIDTKDTNVFRYRAYPRGPFVAHGFYVRWNEWIEVEIPQIAPIRFDFEFNRTDSFVEWGIFANTQIAFIFQNQHHIGLPKQMPVLVQLAEECACKQGMYIQINRAFDTTLELKRPRYNWSGCANESCPICHQVTCIHTLHLAPNISDTNRINMRMYQEMSPFITVTDGDVKISNPRTQSPINSFSFETTNASIIIHEIDPFTFHDSARIDRINEDEIEVRAVTYRDDCKCPPETDKPNVNFEVSPECEYFNCIMELDGDSPYLIYESDHACPHDYLLIKHGDNIFREAGTGRNYVPSSDSSYNDLPMMIWYQRDAECDKTTRVNVTRGDHTCNCPPLLEHRLSPHSRVHLHSPGFGTKSSYCPGLSCTVRMVAPEDHHVVFSFTFMDIADDTLEIYFGDLDADLRESLTGTETEFIDYDTGESTAVLLFTSNDQMQGRGYNVTAVAIPYEKNSSWWWKILIVFVVMTVVVAGFVQRKRLLLLISSVRDRSNGNFVVLDNIENRMFA